MLKNVRVISILILLRITNPRLINNIIIVRLGIVINIESN